MLEFNRRQRVGKMLERRNVFLRKPSVQQVLRQATSLLQGQVDDGIGHACDWLKPFVDGSHNKIDDVVGCGSHCKAPRSLISPSIWLMMCFFRFALEIDANKSRLTRRAARCWRRS